VTYAQFLLAFVCIPILGLTVLLAVQRRLSGRLGIALGVTALVAVVYTAPWDNLLLAQSVWSYPPGRVWGPTIGLVPLEEYAFFVLQVVFIGLLTVALGGLSRVRR
jgi:lycopene cyclase domain-containing protein